MSTALPNIPYTEVQCLQGPKLHVIGIFDVQKGDCGKGTLVRHALLEEGGRKAALTWRFNGSANAGHTFYVRPDDPEAFFTAAKRQEYAGKGLVKFDTHQVPCGVAWKIPSVIGFNCLNDLVKIAKEILIVAEKLGRSYQEVADLIKVVPETHLILPEHIAEDQANNIVGTTGSGIGNGYAAKMKRVGIRVIDFYNKCVDGTAINFSAYKSLFDTIYASEVHKKLPFTCENNRIWGIEIKSWKSIFSTLQDGDVAVAEGAQAYWLDINQGKYPFVTSSDCTIGAICSYGFELACITSLCISKLYGTYVGEDPIEEGYDKNILTSGVFELLRRLGREYGTTTGRRRQCYFINLDDDFHALWIDQGNKWYIKKGDVLEAFDRCLKKLQKYVETGTLEIDENKEEDMILQTYIKDTNYDKKLYTKLIERGAFVLVHKGEIKKFDTRDKMNRYIVEAARQTVLPKLKQIIWHDSKASEFTLKKTE